MKQPSSKKTARRPGRPADQRDAGTRDALILAARTEFALHGFRGTTVRHVATRANVTPAMVHYHFGDKAGLYRAMLNETAAPLFERLEALAKDGGVHSLEEALAAYMRQLARTPELPALILRDVLSAEGAMRDTFVRDFATRGAQALREIVRRDVASGRLRDDLDPRFLLISLMSLAAFPFIARPVAEKVVGMTYDDASVERLAEHSARLLREGICRKESS